jgi:hypothetical protein
MKTPYVQFNEYTQSGFIGLKKNEKIKLTYFNNTKKVIRPYYYEVIHFSINELGYLKAWYMNYKTNETFNVISKIKFVNLKVTTNKIYTLFKKS